MFFGRTSTIDKSSRRTFPSRRPSSRTTRRDLALEFLESRLLLSTYYVANSGSDSAAGGSSAPWATLQKAANSAKAGDTVMVQPGNYAGIRMEGTNFGGSASAPILFKANTGDWHTSGVTINTPGSGLTNAIYVYQTKGYMTFQGFNVSGISGKALLANGSPGIQFLNNRVTGAYTGIFSNTCPGIVISGNTVSDAPDEHGIYVNGSDGYTISYNTCYNNFFDGIHTNVQDDTFGSVNNNGLIVGNICYNNGLAGFDLTSISNSTITNNVCYGNGTHGLVLQDITAIGAPPCHDNIIANNTFDASAGNFGIAFGGPDYSLNSQNATVFNNIAFGGSGGIGLSVGSGFDPSAKFSNNITSNSSSLFIGGGDYHLKSTATSAIDKGVGSFNGDAAPATDADKSARPQGTTWDIGAYEFGASGDTTAPVISGVSASGILSVAATIGWTTNEPGDTQVQYGTTTAYGSTSALNVSLLTSHTAALAGLIPSTTYHYRVLSRDAAGNLATSGDFTFTTSAPDIAPPVVSAITASSLTTGGATISWNTDEPSDTQVQYGTTTSYGSSTTLNTSMVTSHSRSISGLAANTTYHYRVLSRDASGNLATSGDFTFTTLADTTPPTLSAITASGVTASAATVTWTTNEASNTQVQYGTTTSYGSSTTLNTSLVTSHTASLAGLAAGTTYHYRVLSRDAAGNLATSGDFTFTTGAADTTPPVISGVNASNLLANSGAILWNSDEASDTQVQYGTTTSYGSSTTLNTSMVTSHSTSLAGLAASTTYHYRVLSRDASGNLATSGDFTFTTPAVTATFWNDSTTPAVPADNDATALELGLKFTSSVSGQVTGVRFYKGTGNTGTHVGHLWDANGNLLASVTFTGESATGWQQAMFSTPVNINANTTYVISYYAPAGHYAYSDSYFASSSFSNGTLTAPSGSNGLYKYATGGGFPTSSFSSRNYWVDVVFAPNPADTTAPVISGVASSNVAGTGATVSWTTNEPSTTQVAYGTSTSYGSLSTLDPSLVTNHSVTLGGLTTNTVYHYQVISRDAAGNVSTSADMTFTTGKKNANPKADVNQDMIVNVSDVALVANTWGDVATPGTLAADVNGDGIVNISDYSMVANNWQLTVDPSAAPSQTSDTAPPTVSVGLHDVTAPANLYTFTINYFDDTAVDISTLDSADIVITGPNGFSQTASFVSVDRTSDGSPALATYAITPPTGTWSNLANGIYTVSIRSNAVLDTLGNPIAASVLGTFQVNLA